ncbi:MAG: Ig-like domain-containing protein [Saprospiraceae bacterium]|nr:Ig-like domain-containing protein [Saprospiraceae bacterium]
MKTKIILSITTILLLILMGSCKKDDFEETEGVCPVVISTIPTNGATNVPLDQVISVTFNEEMNANTINNVTFTVTGSSAISGTIVFQGTTATLTPDSPLTSNTTYTGKVTTGVKDINGNALQTDYIWTFSTGDILSPLVIITDPANLEIDVNINKVITATFNMPMDALTFNATTFKISQGGTDITGSVSYTGVTASFTPTAMLSSNTTYTAVLTKNIKNADGVNLDSDYVWTFTTGEDVALMVISTDPSNNAIDVGLQKIITATFSEPVNGLTINSSSFTVRQGANVVTGTVTYSASTATFTPVQPLLTGSVYTGTISKSVTTIGGVSLTADYIWSFTTESGSTPIVVSTDPKANEMDVVINKTVTATFSEFMNSTTINNTTFTVNQGANKITGTVTYSGTTASFDPATNLLPGTTYTATITTGAKNGNGISLANDYIWNFTTGASVAPTVISTDPANNATNVNANKVVTASFSVVMDESTLNENTFYIQNGTNKIAGTVTYTGTTVSFKPSSNLQAGITYTATITTGAKNLNGTPLTTDYVWVFSTGAALAPTVISTDPAHNATGVNINKTVTATFSTAMDQNTIKGNTFTLKNGASAVAGVITYSGTTASFNPSTNLLSGTTYTATVTTGVQNTSGTPLAQNFVWTFTTAAAVPPTIVSTSPANNATGVNPDKTITVLFSEPMNQSTINGNTFY